MCIEHVGWGTCSTLPCRLVLLLLLLLLPDMTRADRLYLLLDGTLHHIAMNIRATRLTDTMNTTYCLQLGRRVQQRLQ